MSITILIILMASLFDTSNEPAPIRCVLKEEGQLDCLKAIPELKDIINQKNEFSRTALHYAAFQHKKEILEFLLENGASLSVQDVSGNTPLILTLYFTRSKNDRVKPRTVQYLCENTEPGARNTRNNGNVNVISYAIGYYSPEVVKILIECGVKVDKKMALQLLAIRRESVTGIFKNNKKAIEECDEILNLINNFL